MADEEGDKDGSSASRNAAARQSDNYSIDEATGLAVPRNDLLDIARAFLKDDGVKHMSQSDKVEYLKVKGLKDEEIAGLLKEYNHGPEQSLKTVHDTATMLTGKTPPQTVDTTDKSAVSESSSAQPPNAASVPPAREIPPIITYPEFLLKPVKPPPLVTISRLTTAAYTLGAVSALTYGVSKYFVEPMLQTLTEARHDLAYTTINSLDELNTKLEARVSHVPYIAASSLKHDEETASIDSDPTELFHRDIATQTSPSLSRSASTSDLSSHTPDVLTSQVQSLSRLLMNLTSLSSSEDHAYSDDVRLHQSVKSLQEQIETVDNESRRADYSNLSGMYDKNSVPTNKNKKGGLSESQKFKQEIRALKGAFLSSRNFAAPPRTSTPTATTR